MRGGGEGHAAHGCMGQSVKAEKSLLHLVTKRLEGAVGRDWLGGKGRR